MKQNILIRADASASIGIGHIMRDLVLAKQFKEAKVIFATQELEGNINQKIKEEGFAVEILASNDRDELDKIIKKLDIDLLAIDHYEIGYHDERQLKMQNPTLKILSFDDTYERHYCDILLNHNICADESRYKTLVPEWCELRCGTKWTLIRDEFKLEKEIKREKVYDYFVAMGGADTANLTQQIIEKLPASKKIVALTTTANNNLLQLQEFVKDYTNITLEINSNKIAKFLNQSKFSIITPSVIVHEVLFMGVDFLAIKTAENQEEIAKYLKANQFALIENINDIDSWIKPLLIDFIQLNEAKKHLILKWRNHQDIRKWMFDNTLISDEEHCEYIKSLRGKKDKKYFLVRYQQRDIGVVDFTDISKESVCIGLYANPNLKGVGKILIQSILTYGFHTLKTQRLIAEVFEDNIKAIKLYTAFGFKEIKRDKGIIMMELRSEDR